MVAARTGPPVLDPAAIERTWVAGYPPGVPATYRYPEVTLARFLDDAVRDLPGAEATWFGGVTQTYAELGRRVGLLATALVARGVRPGGRVVVAVDDTPALPVSVFAVLRAGGVVVAAPPGELDLAGLAHAHDARLVVSSEPVPDWPGDVLHAPAWEWLPTPSRLLVQARNWARDRGDRQVRLGDAMADAARPVRAVEREPGDPAVILPLDGDAVVHTHRTLVAAAFQARLWVPDVHAGTERLLVASPLTGPAGLTIGLFSAVLAAATLVLPRDRTRAALLEAASRARPTLALASGRLIVGTASEAGRLASLRVCLVDGPVPAEVARRFEVLSGARVRRITGPAAAAGVALAEPVYGRSSPEGTLLPVTDTVATAVAADDRDRQAPVGEVGWLALHGPQVVGTSDWHVTDQRAVRRAGGGIELVAGPVIARTAGGAA